METLLLGGSRSRTHFIMVSIVAGVFLQLVAGRTLKDVVERFPPFNSVGDLPLFPAQSSGMRAY